MPQHAKNPEHRWYFYPVDPPESVFQWQTWNTSQVCIPRPLIPYLLNVMRVYEWTGRVKTNDPSEAQAFVEAWKDLIANIAAAEECNPMPYPIFRMNPSNGCQMQQSIDNGVTWVTVLDTSACMIPADPAPPMIQFRQSPTNPAILQQSLNGGSSWSTAYDYSKYRAPITQYIENVTYNNEVNSYVTENNNLWETVEGDVNQFAPQLVFDGSSKDADRNKAICYAARVILHTMMEVQFKLTEGDGTIVDDLLTLGFGIIGTIAGAAVGAVISSDAVKFLISANGDYERGVYGQYEDEYLCCMYTALKDSIPSAAAFASSLSGSCDLNEEAQLFADYLSPVLADEQNYLAFLRLAAEGVSLGDFLPDCPCEDEEPPEDTPNVNLVNNAPGIYPSTLTFLGHPSGQPGRDIWQVSSVMALTNSAYVGYDVRDNASRCIRIVSYTAPGTECYAADINCSNAFTDHGGHHSAGETAIILSGNTRVPAVPNSGTEGSVFTFTLELV